MSSLIENDHVIEHIDPVAMLPRLGRRAVEYIGERAAAAQAGQPFFLYLPLTSPHAPIVPASKWQGKSGLSAYGDFVMQTDAMVGDVLAALKQHQLADNTLVIFTSDNGCSPVANPGQLEKQGHFPSAQFRGYKADIWDGGHRVPFLVRWPAQVKPETQSEQLVCLTDLMATCAQIVGATLPENAGEDSESLLPALLGQADTPPRSAIVHHSIHGKFAIRQGKWKLCWCTGSGGWSKGGGDQFPQLYDMRSDSGETTNQAAAQPQVVSELTALLEKYIAVGRSAPGAEQSNDVKVILKK